MHSEISKAKCILPWMCADTWLCVDFVHLYRDVILARFVDLERELRMLNERAADARRSSLRQLLVVPQLPSDRRRRVEPLARQQAESLPLRLAVKLHAQMVRSHPVQCTDSFNFSWVR